MLGAIRLKNRFTELYLCSLAILIMGLFEIIFNYTNFDLLINHGFLLNTPLLDLPQVL